MFRIGFHSLDRRKYSGSLLRDLGVTSLIINKVPRLSSRAGPRSVGYDTSRNVPCAVPRHDDHVG